MDTLRIGDPLDKSIDIGAIISEIQLLRIRELVEDGVAEGATIYRPSDTCPTVGWFYPPTLLTGVQPAARVAQIEIFGPVLVGMTFRTPKEAVEMANNTAYGLAASIWTESIGVALDMASKVKAGTVWINSTNLFDAASGFGGYRESGFGREGGREGILEYVRFEPRESCPAENLTELCHAVSEDRGAIDRTHKHFIGGKQVRPDSGYSREVDGEEFPRGNRKDIRNAVEAAQKAQPGWATQSAHARAQVLYYLAENLQTLGDEAAVRGAFAAAAGCDKQDGQTHAVATKTLCYSLNEPIGVIAIVCPDEHALSALVELAGAAISMGNSVVVVPSETDPGAAAELYRILDMSDVPAGVFNIVSGLRSELTPTLADHDGVDAIWFFGPPEELADVQRRSAGNLKQVWSEAGVPAIDARIRHATQVKNVWVPYGA
jgi:aldehyde dehydrogenase (NAD+)